MRTRVRRLSVVAGVFLSSVLFATAGVAGTAAAATAKKDPAAVKIPARYLAQKLDWQICDFDLAVHDIVPDAPTTNCAEIVVPMDWRHPDAHPDITLMISYSKATKTSKGLLTTNPGGPGEGALEFSAALAVSKTRMFTDYDLLGFDPRGFGESEQVSCVTTQAKLDKVPTVADPRSRTTKSHTAELAWAKLAGEACTSSTFSQFVSTQQTVDDMEFLRAYLGKGKANYSKLNYIGYSYGTWLGAWYADTYPTRVGRFVLDSNMNWTGTMYGNQLTDSFSFERRRDQMFYPWLARHNDRYGFGTTTAQVSKAYETMRGKFNKIIAAGGFAPTPSQADSIIANQIYFDWQFPEAASSLQDFRFWIDGTAAQRKAAGVRLQAAVSTLKPDATSASVATTAKASSDASRTASAAAASEPVTLDGLEGDIVRCNDSAYPTNLTTVLKRADSDAKKYPFIGYTDTVSMCSYWKFKPQTRTIDLKGAPTMLMFQSEGDPATAYEGALAAHKKAGHTRLVSVDNEGQHGVYIDGPSPCVEKAGDAFVFSGKLPKADTTCSTTPLLYDKKVYSLSGPLNGHSFPINAKSLSVTQTAGGSNALLRAARERAAQVG